MRVGTELGEARRPGARRMGGFSQGVVSSGETGRELGGKERDKGGRAGRSQKCRGRTLGFGKVWEDALGSKFKVANVKVLLPSGTDYGATGGHGRKKRHRDVQGYLNRVQKCRRGDTNGMWRGEYLVLIEMELCVIEMERYLNSGEEKGRAGLKTQDEEDEEKGT